MPGLIHGLDPVRIAANLEEAREAAGEGVEVLAATKYVPIEEMGALAEAFRELIEYIQSIASAADTVSKGDLTVRLAPKSEQDVLSRSFARMVDKLREMNGRTSAFESSDES